MGAYWLTDLPAVLAGAGLAVDVWPGWETRSRSSGGYDDVRAVFCHHTASSSSPSSDMSYMWGGSPDEPVGAIYLARDGRLTVGAAGATNTQGKGGPWNLSRGTIPKDAGNAYGIAIEAANAGTGEPWPAAQLDAFVRAAAALCHAYGLDPSWDVLSHREWCEPSCPGRKIDPAGPSPYASGSASWDMAAFRRDVVAASSSPAPPDPVPVPPNEGDEMSVVLRADDDPNGTCFWWDGRQIGWIRTGTAIDVGRVCGLYTSEPLANFSAGELQAMIDSGWAGGPIPPGYAPPGSVDSGVT